MKRLDETELWRLGQKPYDHVCIGEKETCNIRLVELLAVEGGDSVKPRA